MTKHQRSRNAVRSGSDVLGLPVMRRFGTVVVVGAILVALALLLHSKQDLAHTTTGSASKVSDSPVLVAGGLGFFSLQGRIFHTSDGGVHWTSSGQHESSNFSSDAADYDASASEHWEASTQSDGVTTTVVVSHTRDNGVTWQVSSLPTIASPYARPINMQFLPGGKSGWLVVDTTVGHIPNADLFSTADGGATWSSVALPVSGQITMSSTTTGWLVGGHWVTLHNVLAVTHDGGHSWQEASLPGLASSPQNVIGQPAFWDAHSGIVAIHSGSSLYIYSTTDGGQTWHAVAKFTNVQDDAALPFVSRVGNYAWVAVGSSLFASQDSGATWTQQSAAPALVGAIAVQFVSPNVGWAVTENGFCTNGKTNCGTRTTVYQTHDSGATWLPVAVPGLQAVVPQN